MNQTVRVLFATGLGAAALGLLLATSVSGDERTLAEPRVADENRISLELVHDGALRGETRASISDPESWRTYANNIDKRSKRRATPDDDDDDEDRCDDFPCGNGDRKRLICHVPPGNPDNPQTLCISRNAIPAHLDHPGDHCGPCEDDDGGGDNDDDGGNNDDGGDNDDGGSNDDGGDNDDGGSNDDGGDNDDGGSNDDGGDNDDD